MSQQNLNSFLNPAIARLEAVYSEVVKSQGFNEETEKLLILIELLKEQRAHENSGDTTR